MIHFHKWENIYSDYYSDHYEQFRKCSKCGKKQVLAEQWSTSNYGLCGYLGHYLWENLTPELEIKLLSAIELMLNKGYRGHIPFEFLDPLPSPSDLKPLLNSSFFTQSKT